jgi:hypothetical protein
MLDILDRIQAMGTSDQMLDVIGPSGRGRRKMHLWGFSDDDFGNFSTALKVLTEQMKPSKEYPHGRWPDIKIALFFTGGKNNPTEKPRTVVLTAAGGSRPARPSEIGEARKVLCKEANNRLLRNL